MIAIVVQWQKIHVWMILVFLISTDPIAIDQACIDLVYASNDKGRNHLIERIESRHGIHTIEAALALGYGSREYELIEIDD